MLDVESTTRGLLIPRLALVATNSVNPVTAPATSLLVYNTASASSGSTAVFPGYYYWDGAKWVALVGPNGRDWALEGNAGTVAGTNFLGTTDNVDLVFKVNNIQSGRISSSTSSPSHNSFYGYESGLTSAGSFNAYFGSQAGKANSSGGNNVGLGFGAMRNSVTANTNVFIGNNAGANWVTTLGNTAIGNQALQGLAASTGVYNTALGFAAGSGFAGGTANGLSNLSGSYNTYIGYSASGANSSNTFTNSTAIGAFSQAGANDVIVLGSISGANTASATTNVLIGRTSNFAANTPMVYTSSALQIENSSTNRNGLYIRNTGTGGSAGVGSYSESYIGVFGTTKDFFGMYGGVVGTPTGNAYGVGGTSIVNGSGVPLVITPGANVGVVATSTAAAYGAYISNTAAAGWALYSNGDAGKNAGTTWIVSDKNLKTDIKPLENVLDKVIAMNPVTYKFRDDYAISDGEKIGFLSQDIQKIFPALVKEKILPNPISIDANGVETQLSKSKMPETALFMDMESMTPILFQAIKEQQAQIELLKKEIEQLKAQK